MRTAPRPCPRWWVATMLAALFLMVSAPDHWGLRLPAPGASHAHHAHSHDNAPPAGDGDDDHHSRHCHGDAATCSDLPLTAVGGLASLAAWLAFEPPAGAAIPVGRPATALTAHSTAPEPPPPRASAAL